MVLVRALAIASSKLGADHPVEVETKDRRYFMPTTSPEKVGDRKEPIPASVRIFNKVGQAYGYLLDNPAIGGPYYCEAPP